MTKTLTLTTALSLIMAVGCYPALAQNASPHPSAPTKATATPAHGQVDVSNLVGRNVVNSKGETVGEIESVMVNDSGAVDNIIVDVSGWLQSEKLISVAWKDLTISPDGKTITSATLTKETGTSAPAYKYSDESWRGKVMTRSGKPYAIGSAMPSFGTPVMNADGSLNASQIIGFDIQGPQNEKIGDIDDLLMAKDGHIESVIIDVGGFLGVGARPVRVAWKDIAWSGQGGKAVATVNYTKDRLEKMPEYKAAVR